MNELDARGYSCPEPVLMTKAALKKGVPLKVLVDSMTPVQNITRSPLTRVIRSLIRPWATILR